MSATGELRRPEVAEPPPPAGWSELLRTAHLFTADHGAAEELAVAALVRVGRRRWWGRPAPDPRRLLLTLRASPARGLPPGRPSAAARPDDPFLRAYQGLPARGRALLVLRVADGLDEQAAAQAGGVPVASARAETVAALDALRAPLADRAGGPTLDAAGAGAIELDLGETSGAPQAAVHAAGDPLDAADPVVSALRRLFADLDAHLPTTARPGERVAQAIARDRARRRSAVAVGAVLVALTAIGGGLAAHRHAQDEAARELAARRQALEAVLHPLVLGADVSTWPTRGSHAGDADLLARVRRRVGAGVALPFAGTVGDLDVALVYAGTPDNPRLYVLHGPPGSDPAGWAEDDGVPEPSDAAVLSAAVRDDAGSVHLVVATLSRGVSAAYSPAARIGDDATVSREYRALRLDDGVGTAVTPGEPRRFALRLQYGANVAIQPVDVAASAVQPPDPAAGRVPAAVRRAASCAGLAVADDTGTLIELALDQARVAAADVTAVRELWCDRSADRSGLALAISARHGPDIQCHEEVVRSDAGLGFQRICWPVPRGRALSAPFVSPSGFDEDPGAAHGVTVWAPGASRLELASTTVRGQRVVARAAFTPGGVARVVVGGADEPPVDGLYVILRDSRGQEITRLPALNFPPGDGWGATVDGPVLPPAE